MPITEEVNAKEVNAPHPLDVFSDTMNEMIEDAATVLPSWAQLSVKVGEIMQERREWAGCPVPLTDHVLSVETKHPYAEMLNHYNGKPEVAEDEDDGEERFVTTNRWYCKRRRIMVFVLKSISTGRSICWKTPHNIPALKINALMETLSASVVWSLDAELAACGTLCGLIAPHMAEYYFMTGTIIETSKRSGVTYIFRKNRPTLALRQDRTTGQVILLSALCLHPIAYYEGTHAGCMVPTDDLIAHLLLMRADEPMFWRRANQHPLDSAEAAL